MPQDYEQRNAKFSRCFFPFKPWGTLILNFRYKTSGENQVKGIIKGFKNNEFVTYFPGGVLFSFVVLVFSVLICFVSLLLLLLSLLFCIFVVLPCHHLCLCCCSRCYLRLAIFASFRALFLCQSAVSRQV